MASSAAPSKILVAGDTRGELGALFERAAAVDAKHGPFACLLCVGDFLGTNADAALAPYRASDGSEAERKAPLPTYFISAELGEAASPLLAGFAPGDELAPRISYLGPAGVRELGGLQVAFVSGAGEGEAGAQAVAELRALGASAAFGGVDVLLSARWPRGFFRAIDPTSLPADLLPDKDLPEVGSEALAELAVGLRARYHFCGGEGQAYARPAYRLPVGGGATQVCRLVALAPVGPDKKQKWLHALSLVPLAKMAPGALAQEPAGTTDCPYPYARLASGGGGGGGKRQRTEYVKDSRAWVNSSCWFCMSAPQFEAHLVASISDEAYVTLAKGPLVPHHCLVIPISHKPSSLDLAPHEQAEVAAYCDALRACFAASGESVLIFERYMGSGSFEHMHLQVVPLPHHLATGARDAFVARGKSRGINFEVLPAGASLASRFEARGTEPFFRVELPSGEQLLHMLASCPRKHPLQFGREVVAAMLGAPHRADWKVCMPPAGGSSVETVEAQATDAFKQLFAPHDPAGRGA